MDKMREHFQKVLVLRILNRHKDYESMKQGSPYASKTTRGSGRESCTIQVSNSKSGESRRHCQSLRIQEQVSDDCMVYRFGDSDSQRGYGIYRDNLCTLSQTRGSKTEGFISRVGHQIQSRSLFQSQRGNEGITSRTTRCLRARFETLKQKRQDGNPVSSNSFKLHDLDGSTTVERRIWCTTNRLKSQVSLSS